MELLLWLTAGVALGAVGLGLAAYVIALRFRRRVGFPQPKPSDRTPSDFGLESQTVRFPTVDRDLPGWFIPARRRQPGPGIIVVHGWEGNRGRMLPVARFLHAQRLHVLLFDVRGHGDNSPEAYLTGAEFVQDTLAAIEYLAGRREVNGIGLFGHSAGGTASILAASRDSRVRAVVSSSAFAGPVELTQRLLGLAGLPTWRLFAEFVARVYVQPRGHRVGDYHAWQRIAFVNCPILLIHAEKDAYIPSEHLFLLARAANSSRTETWLVPGRGHRDLFGAPGYAGRVSNFFSRHLSPADAAPGAGR